MNTNTNTAETETTTAVKRSVGRPTNPDCTRQLTLKQEADGVFTVLGKGRRSPGDYYTVTVHRSINSLNYQHGITPTHGEMTKFTVAESAPKSAKEIMVTVHVPQNETTPVEVKTENQGAAVAV